jgi:hypothetical protein
MTINDVLPKLKNVKKTHNGWSALCPAHDDQKRSLSIAEKDGKILLNCFAGCAYGEIISTLGINVNGNQSKGKIVAVYNYTDESGELLYQNVRFEPKDFRQRHLDKNGRELWNLNGVRRVPYRLPELSSLNAFQDLVMTEGEKDADILTKLGFPATSHKNWQKDFNYLLNGKNVILFQDHDRAGVEQAEKVAKLVYPNTKAIKVVDCFAGEPLPEKHGKDISDYLETHSLEELRELIKQTPIYTPSVESVPDTSKELEVVCLTDVESEETNWLWKPFIPIGEFTLIDGIEGLGKSWVCCALACAVAGGNRLPFSESEAFPPSNVLIMSAEDSLSKTVKPRLISMKANLTRIFAIDELFSLSDDKDLIRFEAIIAKYEPILVIIDPIFSYTGGKNLNQESESRPIAQKLIKIAQKFNCAILGVRHIGKSKGNGEARAAGLGSISWRASARSGLLVGKDEETGETAICQTKCNLAPTANFAVGYEIKDGNFYWKGEPSKLTPDKMLAQPKDNETKAQQTEAVEFLREVLKDGERLSTEVTIEAKELKLTDYSIRKAKAILGVESFKKGGNFGGEKSWYLRLPNTELVESVPKDVDTSAIQHLQSNQRDKTSYGNNLAENVETGKNGHFQRFQAVSSSGLVPVWRVKAVCKCGAGGFVGEDCPNCNEPIIPF